MQRALGEPGEYSQLPTVLYIEPTGPEAPVPVLDSLTRRMAAALDKSTIGILWRGFHGCTGKDCPANSSASEHIITAKDGTNIETNALCVHYLAHHRDEISTDQLAYLDLYLPADEIDPTPRMLRGWRFGEKMADEEWTHRRGPYSR